MKNKDKNIVRIVMLVSIFVITLFSKIFINDDSILNFTTDNYVESVSTDLLADASKLDGSLKIHFIDVGQADSILITEGENSMLIDAGTNEAGKTVVDYIKSQSIDNFDYVIGTHPHEDHIGGLDNVIDNFAISTLLLPKVTSNTKTFKDVVNSAKSKNLKLTVPKVGNTYRLGKATFEILAPNSEDYESTNNYSVVVKIIYGNNKFLFTGDAEYVSEYEILDNNIDISADVLKVGHHGSYTSTSDKFLNAVKPKYAVICVGKDNRYNHPVKSVMEKLKKNNIDVYRTDECGNIVLTSDGENITFNVNKGSYNYIGTK